MRGMCLSMCTIPGYQIARNSRTMLQVSGCATLEPTRSYGCHFFGRIRHRFNMIDIGATVQKFIYLLFGCFNNNRLDCCRKTCIHVCLILFLSVHDHFSFLYSFCNGVYESSLGMEVIVPSQVSTLPENSSSSENHVLVTHLVSVKKANPSRPITCRSPKNDCL